MCDLNSKRADEYERVVREEYERCVADWRYGYATWGRSGIETPNCILPVSPQKHWMMQIASALVPSEWEWYVHEMTHGGCKFIIHQYRGNT